MSCGPATRAWILPRNPKPTFAQLEAILGRERFVVLDIMAERPLADALAQIDADLDAAVYNSTSA